MFLYTCKAFGHRKQFSQIGLRLVEIIEHPKLVSILVFEQAIEIFLVRTC